MATSDPTENPSRELNIVLPTWLRDDNLFGSPFVSVEAGEISFSSDGNEEEVPQRLEAVGRIIEEMEFDNLNPGGTFLYEVLCFERQQLLALMD
jgi:hypothetical protein